MHGLGAARLAGGDDLVDDEIALGRGRRADGDGRVRHLDVQRVLVGVGIDGDGLDPHPAGGLDDPAGDFAAIGDQNALEHGRQRPPPRAGTTLRRAAKSQCGPLAAVELQRRRSGRPSAARRAPEAASRSTIPCSTGKSKRRVMKRRIDVVSYWVWSTKPFLAKGEMIDRRNARARAPAVAPSAARRGPRSRRSRHR